MAYPMHDRARISAGAFTTSSEGLCRGSRGRFRRKQAAAQRNNTSQSDCPRYRSESSRAGIPHPVSDCHFARVRPCSCPTSNSCSQVLHILYWPMSQMGQNHPRCRIWVNCRPQRLFRAAVERCSVIGEPPPGRAEVLRITGGVCAHGGLRILFISNHQPERALPN
jgi:hypothetical protein